jgi:hypothetical protein
VLPELDARADGLNFDQIDMDTAWERFRKYARKNGVAFSEEAPLEYIEADPIPQDCQTCTEPDCDVCDHGRERWLLPPETELRLKRKLAHLKK